MKYLGRNFFPLLILAPLLTVAAFANDIVETAHEFQFSADLDGDGRSDWVIVDKASGGFRVGYQLSPGAWTWSAARATGMSNVTGVAAGKWFATNRDAFAVVSPLANRVHIVRAPTVNQTPELSKVYTASVGPAAVAAPDIGGPGNTLHADLWVVAVENGAASPVRTNTLRHNGTSFTPIADLPRTRVPQFVSPMLLKQGGASVLAYMDTAAGFNDRFSAISFPSGNAVEMVFTNVPEGSHWTSGKLGGDPLHHVLTWLYGADAFLSHAITEGPPTVFALAPAVARSVGVPIGQLRIVAGAGGPRIVVIDSTGQTASIFAYDGAGEPVLVQSFNAEAGEAFTGVLPLPGGGFQMLSGRAGTGQSESLRPYTPSGDGFVAGARQTLPTLRPAALRANVFAFTAEPFVDPEAILLGRYSAPEWSSDPSLAGDQLTVLREVFGGAASGLGSKSAVNIGSVPAGTAFALTSQYGESVSIHSYDSGDGAIGPSVEISPLPGMRSQGFWLSFIPSSAQAPVFFRINDGEWQVWSGQKVFIYQDADIAYFIRHPITNEPSPMRIAQYRFDRSPHLMDSDDDGIPDFVELGLAEITEPKVYLDPLAGVDSDGDGFSDLTEILLGTNPMDAESRPLPHQRLEEGNAFRMRVAPRPIDGTNGARAQVAQGIRLELYALDGTSLGGSAALPLATPGVIGSGHRADNVSVDPRFGMVAIITEPVFPIATVDADKERGREIAGLFVIPQGQRPVIDYTPGNGSLAHETQVWIAAATLAYNNAERATVAGNWNEIDTLIGLILERKLETVLLARELEGLDPGRLSLFGGRRGDTSRFHPPAEALFQLREQVSPALPGYDLRQLFASISTAVNAPGAAGLRAAATAIYRISSANANAQPPGTYLPPFDVLRSFVRGEPLPEPYASEVGITPAAIQAAQATIASMVSGLPARPVESYAVIVQADSFTGACHRVFLLGTDLPVNLFAAPQQPYTPPIGFSLLPGTKLHVSGYTDLDSTCTGINLELLSLTVLEFPPVPVVDANNNLLPDDWEWAFLLGDADPFDDADGDGVSNLQEFLDGTDPMNPDSKPDLIVNLAPPAVEIFLHEDEGVLIFWEYPPAYAGQISWQLEFTTDLIQWQVYPEIPVIEVDPGLYAMQLPPQLFGFYRLQMGLAQH